MVWKSVHVLVALYMQAADLLVICLLRGKTVIFERVDLVREKLLMNMTFDPCIFVEGKHMEVIK
jgi:hypothetical protein